MAHLGQAPQKASGFLAQAPGNQGMGPCIPKQKALVSLQRDLEGLDPTAVVRLGARAWVEDH